VLPSACSPSISDQLAQHAQLRIETGLAIYFCDPHSPWQRGPKENTNGLLRQYFPKDTDLSRHTPADLAAVAAASTAAPARPSDGEPPAEAPNEQPLLIQRSGVATTP
jgi:transposase, IS30 family